MNGGTQQVDYVNVDRRKLFAGCLNAFYKDFDFVDVQDDLVCRRLITENECKQIINDKRMERQLERLFFLLTYDEDKSIQTFTSVLQPYYSWLAKLLEHSIRHPKDDSPDIVTCINRSWMPSNRNVCRVHRCELLWDVVDQLKALSRQQYLIIRGNRGAGKTWLATDACQDHGVIQSTDFHIFWLDVSKCVTQERNLEAMQTLKIMMGSDLPTTEPAVPMYDSVQLRIAALKKHFQDTFSNENYEKALLVLCNVEDQQVLRDFDFHCKILATGRDESCFDEIPNSRKHFVVVNRGFKEHESFQLFEKLVKGVTSAHPNLVRGIHRLCEGEPFIISLIANNIAQLNGSSREQRLGKYIQELEQRQLADGKLDLMIEESLSVLPVADRDAYMRMVVFPDYISVTIPVLARYLRKDEAETEQLIQMFYRYSLLSVDYRKDTSNGGDDGETVLLVSKHYIYSSYLKKLYKEEELTQLHLDICESYGLESLLENRTEPDLFDLPNDGYIHYYIGHHLQRAGLQHLFPRLYFDFGFLEQKLRYSGLPNTHGDLEAYKEDIVGGDANRHVLWDQLLVFLPTIEEMMHDNNDTSLLQYALNAGDAIAEEAERQVERFQDRVWFDDFSRPAKQRRQMVQLNCRPLQLKFFGPEAIIAALDDNSLELRDMSPSYVAEPTIFKGHKEAVCKMTTFGRHYLLSLDTKGVLFVWSMKETPIYRAKFTETRNGLTEQQEDPVMKMRKYDVNNINYSQALDKIIVMEKFKCFTISESNVEGHECNGTGPKEIMLICGTETGKVLFYEWNENDEKFMKNGEWQAKYKSIKALQFIKPRHMMVLNDDHMTFLNTITTSEMPTNFGWVPTPNPIAIYETRTDLGKRLIYCVFQMKIVCVTIEKFHEYLVQIAPHKVVYKTRSRAAITCSTLSEDGKYLLLGTLEGIVVFDCSLNTGVQRSIGDQIVCIDMCTCDDMAYRYLMISGKANGRQNVVNLYSMPGKLTNVPPTLVGGNRFEVIQTKGTHIIYAVDTENRIQMSSSLDAFVVDQDLSGPWGRITATSQFYGMFCFGCVDGKFYTTFWQGDHGQMAEQLLDEEFKEAIVYIKGIDPYYWVIGTDTKYKILNWRKLDDFIIQGGKIVDCYSINGDGKILIVCEKHTIQLVDMGGASSMGPKVRYLLETAGNSQILGCDYQRGTLALVDNQDNIRFYNWDSETPDYDMNLRMHPKKKLIQYQISRIALSPDASILAVGSKKGEIYIFRMSDLQKLQILSSHKQPIKQLVFSPWSIEGVGNNPIVLVSLAEQMCFWNIKFVINNPSLDALKANGFRRSSKRFSKEFTKLQLNANKADPHRNQGNERNGAKPSIAAHHHIDYWNDKTGASDKRELLACIKFVGNSATKLVTNAEFNTFITIDNEGDIYALTTTRSKGLEKELDQLSINTLIS